MYSKNPQIFSVHAQIALLAPTLVLGLSSFDRRSARKSSIFFLSPSSSPPLRSHCRSPPFLSFPSLFPTNSFSFFLCFSFFSFSSCFSFLFAFTQRILLFYFFLSLFLFLIFSSFLLGFFSCPWMAIDRMGQRRQFPPHFLISTCVAILFPSFFFYLLLL